MSTGPSCPLLPAHTVTATHPSTSLVLPCIVFLGETAADMTAKIPFLLHSVLPSVPPHVGCNDMVHHQTELTKHNFKVHVDSLKHSWKSIFIGGQIPSALPSAECFSRPSLLPQLLALFPLQSTKGCTTLTTSTRSLRDQVTSATVGPTRTN